MTHTSSTENMLFASGLSTESDSREAEAEVLELVLSGLDGRRPDLLVLFATPHHAAILERMGPKLREHFGAEVTIGCTAEGVIGDEREIEGQPGLSLWAASLPGCTLRGFHCTARQGEGEEFVFDGFPTIEDPERASLLLIGDPFTFPADAFLAEHDRRTPGVPVMGGMSSGGSAPGQAMLISAQGRCASGAVGVVLEGDVGIRPVVSQGCRPVGKPLVITDGESNLIRKLGGRSAVEVLTEVFHSLTPEDRMLLQSAPFLGLAIDPMKSQFARGDFLVRNVMGIHPEDKALVITDRIRRGQTVQFMVRDAESAGEDLRHLMSEQGGGGLAEGGSPRSAGALIFSCNGRGQRMFAKPHHDIACVRSGLDAEIPIAGFFAAGEIGPVGRRNFVHGFTASVAIFRPRGS